MNQADEELRVTISQIWPLQANKMLDLLVPPIHQLNKNNLTVGKIYGGLLVLETWRNTKFIELRNAKEVKIFTFFCLEVIKRIILGIDRQSNIFSYLSLQQKLLEAEALAAQAKLHPDHMLNGDLR